VTGRRRTAPRAASAAASAAVLAALTVGLPAALCAAAGFPVPRALPDWNHVTAALTRPDNGSLFLAAVKTVSWLAWAAFVISVLAETRSRATHRPAPRLPGIAPLQQLAATLMSAAVLAVPPVPQAPHPPPRPAAAAAHPWRPQQLRPAAARTTPLRTANRRPAPRPPASGMVTRPRIYRVVEGDNLWNIAQRYLGNPELWHEIWLLNRGRLQADGGTLTDPNLIYPGWIFLLPARPASHPVPRAGTGREQHDCRPGPAPAPVTRPSPGRPSPSPRPRLPSAFSRAPGSASAQRPRPNARAHTGERQPAAVELPSGALVGLSLATAAGIAIVSTRLHRRRRREPAPAPGTAPGEPALGPALRRLRHAHLTGISQHTGTPGAEPDDTEPTATARPSAADDGIPPRCEGSTETVTVAVRDGQEISLDLTCAPGVGFTGPGAAAAIRAIAVTLLARRARDQAEVILCGEDACRLLTPGSGEPALGVVPGLTALPGADDALGRLETEIIRRRRLLDATDDDLAAYRAASPNEHLPTTLVIAPADGPRAPRLAAVLKLGQRLGITGALHGPWPPGVTCEIAVGGQVTTVSSAELRDLERSRMFQLAPGDAAEILAALAAASGAAHPPDAGGQPRLLTAPPAGEPEPGERPAYLSVLGPFQLQAGGEFIARGLRRKAAELLAYLAVHPDGATSEAILDALWPDTPVQRAAPILHAATTNIRKILRDATAAPEAGFIVRVGRQLRLDPHLVDVDLWRFQAALASAAHAPDDKTRSASLNAATQLWRGDLAESIDAVWIEEFRETLRRDAVDTLARLAQLCEHETPDEALALLERAISIDRYQEPLYRRIMRIQGSLGRPDAARRTYQLLESRLTELDAEPEDTTARLLHQILHPQNAHGHHVGSEDQ
jgi:DNA-binding SARP family transcriptional activator/nucleoid-associated protein YgaU